MIVLKFSYHCYSESTRFSHAYISVSYTHLITHQMQVVQMICNKVAVMESGKIVESGSVLEVFGSPKMPVTKRFVQTVIRDQIPDSIISLVKEQKENFRVDRLKFIGSSVKRPVRCV